MTCGIVYTLRRLHQEVIALLCDVVQGNNIFPYLMTQIDPGVVTHMPVMSAYGNIWWRWREEEERVQGHPRVHSEF